jgi:hypothetical protein
MDLRRCAPAFEPDFDARRPALLDLASLLGLAP